MLNLICCIILVCAVLFVGVPVFIEQFRKRPSNQIKALQNTIRTLQNDKNMTDAYIQLLYNKINELQHKIEEMNKFAIDTANQLSNIKYNNDIAYISLMHTIEEVNESKSQKPLKL